MDGGGNVTDGTHSLPPDGFWLLFSTTIVVMVATVAVLGFMAAPSAFRRRWRAFWATSSDCCRCNCRRLKCCRRLRQGASQFLLDASVRDEQE